eukprot:511103_1
MSLFLFLFLPHISALPNVLFCDDSSSSPNPNWSATGSGQIVWSDTGPLCDVGSRPCIAFEGEKTVTSISIDATNYKSLYITFDLDTGQFDNNDYFVVKASYNNFNTEAILGTYHNGEQNNLRHDLPSTFDYQSNVKLKLVVLPDVLTKEAAIDNICMYGSETKTPTKSPTINPTVSTINPTITPTMNPTLTPTVSTITPTISTSNPTITTVTPTIIPTKTPSSSPITASPSITPTIEMTKNTDKEQQVQEATSDTSVTVINGENNLQNNNDATHLLIPIVVGVCALIIIVVICIIYVLRQKTHRQQNANNTTELTKVQSVDINTADVKAAIGEEEHNNSMLLESNIDTPKHVQLSMPVSQIDLGPLNATNQSNDKIFLNTNVKPMDKLQDEEEDDVLYSEMNENEVTKGNTDDGNTNNGDTLFADVNQNEFQSSLDIDENNNENEGGLYDDKNRTKTLKT